MIRKAEITDFCEILRLGEELWNESEFDEEYDPKHTMEMVKRCFNDELLVVLVVDGSVEGYVAGIKGPSLCSTAAVWGNEISWWVRPEFRMNGNGFELLSFIENLAKEQGVKYWTMVSMKSSMQEKVNDMYEKMGYHLTESSFLKVL